MVRIGIIINEDIQDWNLSSPIVIIELTKKEKRKKRKKDNFKMCRQNISNLMRICLREDQIKFNQNLFRVQLFNLKRQWTNPVALL